MVRKLHLLVTGASGFVGDALVRLAQSRGHTVIALVRNAVQTPRGCEALVHDLGSGAALILPDRIDAIAHLAQSRDYRAFPGDAEVMFKVNVAGTHELLVAAAKSGVTRFCLCSSGTVYEPFNGPLTEIAQLAPPGNLGATKLAAEALSRPFATQFALSVIRLFSPYGPGQAGRLIPDLIRRVREQEAVTLPAEGSGMQFSPSYVDDICEAMLTAIEESWTGTFNVASPEALSIESATRQIARAIGKEALFSRGSASSGAAPIIIPDLAKFAARYDLDRFRSFADGIALTLSGKP